MPWQLHKLQFRRVENIPLFLRGYVGFLNVFSKHDFQQMIVKGKHDYHELQGIHDGKLGRDYHNWFESSGVCALCLENQVLTHMGLLTEEFQQLST